MTPTVPHIEIYTRAWCSYCSAAKRLLTRKGLSFEETDVEASPGALSVMVQRAGGRRSVPQIFIRGRHVGGSDDLHALDREGRLDALLAG
jgi:glutaredoxin 3